MLRWKLQYAARPSNGIYFNILSINQGLVSIPILVFAGIVGSISNRKSFHPFERSTILNSFCLIEDTPNRASRYFSVFNNFDVLSSMKHSSSQSLITALASKPFFWHSAKLCFFAIKLVENPLPDYLPSIQNNPSRLRSGTYRPSDVHMQKTDNLCFISHVSSESFSSLDVYLVSKPHSGPELYITKHWSKWQNQSLIRQFSHVARSSPCGGQLLWEIFFFFGFFEFSPRIVAVENCGNGVFTYF